MWLVAVTAFVVAAVSFDGVPNVNVRFAPNVPPPLKPFPATSDTAALAFKFSASCKPLTRSTSARPNARFPLASVCTTVSNAVTGSTFQPTPHAATVAPAALYLASTSDTVTVG
ncbi:hypothetical protein D3C87_1768010 [compost metagenome]